VVVRRAAARATLRVTAERATKRWILMPVATIVSITAPAFSQA